MTKDKNPLTELSDEELKQATGGVNVECDSSGNKKKYRNNKPDHIDFIFDVPDIIGQPIFQVEKTS